jgi:predicted alpha/beta-fold hydrolase
VVASLDDPWVPGSVYAGSRWGPSKHVSTQLLPSRGGHVGFHGTGSRQPWSDRAVLKFLAKNGVKPPVSSSCSG